MPCNHKHNCVILKNQVMWWAILLYFGWNCPWLIHVDKCYIVNVKDALCCIVQLWNLGSDLLPSSKTKETCNGKHWGKKRNCHVPFIYKSIKLCNCFDVLPCMKTRQTPQSLPSFLASLSIKRLQHIFLNFKLSCHCCSHLEHENCTVFSLCTLFFSFIWKLSCKTVTSFPSQDWC